MQRLFLFLSEQFDLVTFVETGTFQGATAAWASAHFERVITIEGDETLYQAAQRKLAAHPNVECRWGDSRQLLPPIARQVSERKVYWLDAHWSGGNTFGEHAECPLVDELVAIYETGEEPFVVIDDARFFVSLPPFPHDIHSWPGYFEIARVVRKRSPSTFITVHADAIVLAPAWSAELLIPFLRTSAAELDDSRATRRPWWLRLWRKSA